MQNMQAKIGQAIVSCIALNNRENELEFTWVQEFRDFEELVGQSLIYGSFQGKSNVRLGNRSEGDTQPVVFEPTYSKEEMLDNRQYACLIKWVPGSTDQPEILGFDLKSTFDEVVEELKARKNAFVPSTPREQEVKVKSKFKFKVVQEVEDPSFYRVKTMGRTKAGNIKDIVTDMTKDVEGDPTQMLLLGTWEKKGSDNRYARCELPNIPEPPKMLLDIYKNKSAS